MSYFPAHYSHLKRLGISVIAGSFVAITHIILPIDASAKVNFEYAPASSAVFASAWNGGNTSEAKRIDTLLHNLISNSRQGSSVYIATLRFKNNRTGDLLVKAAVQRKVVVRVLADSTGKTEVVSLHKRLAKAKNGSYAKVCSNTCYTDNVNNDGVAGNHSKLYLFSHSGKAKNVTVTSSQNISKFLSSGGSNDATIQYGNKNRGAYLRLASYFRQMAQDNPKADKDGTTFTANGITYWTYPRAMKKKNGVWPDPFMQTLKQVKCNNASKAYGDNKGHTTIDIAMAQWGPSRMDVVRKLGELRSKGCKIKIVVSKNGMDNGILKELKKAGITAVRNGERYKKTSAGTSVRTFVMHSKYMALSGNIQGDKSKKVVVAGTLNFGAPGFGNDNIIIRTTKNEIVDPYQKNFDLIYEHRSRKL